MAAAGPPTTPVDPAHRFDEERLAAWLGPRLHLPGGPLEVEQFAGGRSNPTFLLRSGSLEWVLRKQPPGELLPSAHAVDREYRVLEALGRTDVPVPRVHLFCDDPSVVGTPFYVMERLHGRVFHDGRLPGVARGQRAQMYESMVGALAGIHAVDWRAAGLADFGRPGNYFERQVARWARQYEATRQLDIPEMDALCRWLPAHVPPGEESAICHGDFRPGNVMFHPAEPRVIAVFDWELSTLGHPLADLGYFCMLWHQVNTDYGGLLDVDIEALGIPNQAAIVARYAAVAGREIALEPFHVAFSLFRFAAILAGVSARQKAGTVSTRDERDLDAICGRLARRGWALARGGS